MKNALATVAVVLWAGAASAAQFTVTITNSGTNANYDFSQGLLTLQPLISIGPSPTSGNPYATYAFANSACNIADTFCTGGCVDNGNATVLAQRWGLTLNSNAWLVNALTIGTSHTLTINAPPGSKLSYIAWINDTGVFDDFVAMHVPGNPLDLQVPLFDASNKPLPVVTFDLGGYDMNSTNPADGNSTTCANQCPADATGCYVAPGNASMGSNGTFTAPQNATAVTQVVTLSGPAKNTVTWTNVAPTYGVVVVRRTGSAVNQAPTNGQTYTKGANLGGGNTVVFAASGASATNTFVDDYGPPANDQIYYYKVYAQSASNRYVVSAVPSANGITGTPTSGVSPKPRWCYTFGYSSMMQPVLALASGVFHASNSGGVTALNPDGSERFRPVAMGAAVQSRFLALPLQGRAGTWLIAGDQAGNVAVIDGSSGELAWTRNLAPDAAIIQAQPSTQLYAASSAAFQSAHPGRDLIFIPSRNGSTTSNTVTALSSVDGTTVWQYKPGNLGDISGSMLLDRGNNRLWVASNNTGASPSLRVLNTITGALVTSYTGLNAVNLPVSWGYATDEAIITNTAGMVRAYNLSTLAQTWTYSGAVQSSYAFPTGDGFIASFASTVQRYTVNPTTLVVTPMWSTAAAVASPTGVRLDYTTQKVEVTNGAGVLSQINVATGVVEKTLTVAAGVALGASNVDPNLSPKRLYVSGVNGALCAYDVPF